MRLLLTSATSDLGASLVRLLGSDHDLTLTDLPAHAEGNAGVTGCELGDDEATDRLVDGIDAIVHIGYGGHFAGPSDLLDMHTRCTYNLLFAAREAGVPRFVNLSTLRLLADYPPHLTVTENWRPLPEVEPLILGAHLCEFVCREFGREGGIKIANLRLGFPLVKGDTGAATASGESAALAEDDLRVAINAALVADLAAGAESAQSPAPLSFRTIHVQSPIPEPRFLLNGAASVLGLWERQGSAR
ncbi:MAG: NAD(P)-dependent oxidoreductase [Chloroflexi bacterium]|nr:NAD(P)-dependent oxidoreductase [Chloroflexota bacterium]